jgi:uncharacterized protein YggE
MHRRTNLLIVTSTLCLVANTFVPASAQSPAPSGTIHATGQHEIKLAPQKLRLSLAIRAEGADAKSAIESFVQHKERVKKELVEMKADETSIEISSPQLSGSMAGIPQEWTSYAPRFLQPPPTPGEPGAAGMPKVFVATAQLKAEWPLPTTDADALAMLPETLKEQIAARDLTGKKNKAKLDAAQQEKIEELQAKMQEAMAYASSDDGQSFSVLFVAKADDHTRRQGIKAAYDRAVAEAELLATATGHKLGDLVSLRCDLAPSMGVGDVTSPYAAAMASYQAANMYPNQSANEAALSTNPAGLKISVKVDVAFAIAK